MARDWYRARAGLSEHVLLDAFERDHGLRLDRQAVVARMRAAYLASITRVKVHEGVARLARSNQGRVPMAVASGGPRAIVMPTLRACGLDTLFEAIVTLDDVGRAKPDPALFLEAARRLNVPPELCLAFEDSEQGLRAARSAGMPVVDVQDLLE